MLCFLEFPKRKKKNLEEMLLELEVWKCSIHVLCLAETWLTTDTQSLFGIDGYKPYYQSRVQRVYFH